MDKKPVYKGIGFDEMHEFLEDNFQKFNNIGFIENDPISIPHKFDDKRDIEISGFLTATISWGRRDQIIRSATKLMEMMGESPYQFLVDADDKRLEHFADFYYRTFQGQDCMWFLKSLKRIYSHYESLEDLLLESISTGLDIKEAIMDFRRVFFETPHQRRSEKHFANPESGAAAKRLNMYFRWMVRNDNRGVDFGIWNKIPTSMLLIPLDIHSGNIARKLGLLERKANDWKAVEELSSNLRLFDANDPVKYDYSLFGLGVNNMI
jgi:uncharacterized protein (TIGR02757 family)